MKRDDRKAALSAYKERKPAAGIYAVRCAATAQCWVGKAPNLGTIQNRLWFTLRQGTNPHRSLQDAWTEHGADSFSFEAVDALDDDLTGLDRDRALTESLALWKSELNAEAI